MRISSAVHQGGGRRHILATTRRLPSEIPPLSAIETKVTADYRTDEAFQAAGLAAQRVEAALTNGLAAGKTFAAICAAEKVIPDPAAVFHQFGGIAAAA